MDGDTRAILDALDTKAKLVLLKDAERRMVQRLWKDGHSVETIATLLGARSEPRYSPWTPGRVESFLHGGPFSSYESIVRRLET